MLVVSLRSRLIWDDAAEPEPADSPLSADELLPVDEWYSSGGKRRQGAITKPAMEPAAAPGQAAHRYRFTAGPPAIQQRQENRAGGGSFLTHAALAPRLSARHKKPVVVAAALARELCGFVWAIACQVNAPQMVKNRPPRAKRTTTAKRDYQLDSKKTFER